MTKEHARREDVVEAKRDIRDPQKEQEVVASPLVTVVIPCYNQAHFLTEAIESVLSQSYPNFEVVVVDDGSTDDTSEVASRYPQQVRLIRQENQGLSGARNTGIRHARGEYVVFLDADDRLLPGALETGVEYLDARPECAFVHGHYRFMADDGSPLREPPRSIISKDRYLALLKDNYVVVPAVVMYRRAVFESVGGFNTSISPAADYDLYLRIARKFPVCSHENVVAEYRQHDSNMTRNPALMLSAVVSALRSQRKHIRGYKQYEEAYKLGLKYWRGKYGDPLVGEVRAQLKEEEWGRALGGLLVLVRYYPQGLALLSERRWLARRLQVSKQRLEARERYLEELERGTREGEAEDALEEERQEVQRLRKRIRKLERRIQNLDRGSQSGLVPRIRKLSKRGVSHLRSRVLRE